MSKYIMKQPNIAIVGSGLVGSLLAIYLRKRNYQVTIFDRRPDIRKIRFSGRSINLAMSVRGWNALEKAGIKKDVEDLGIPMNKRFIHVNNKADYTQNYGKDGEAIYSISRGVLNRKMIDLAEQAGAIFKFEEKVWDVNLPEAKLYTGETEKGEWQEYQFDIIFGCDGAFSRVRHKMQRRSRFDYSQDFLDTGYKELSIPAGKDGKHVIDTAFWKTHFPDTLEIMPTLLEDFKNNPTSALVTTKCFPWTYWNKIALVGDSAHAIVPFYGQGMNAGFEDVFELDQIIEKLGDNDWQAIFEAYQEKRKPNADAIAELSYRNFIEMSSKTANPLFILQKKIEKKFSATYPDLWMPLYSRVTFSNKPYAEALNLGDKQEEIMAEIMALPNIENEWDSETIMNKIKSNVENLQEQLNL